MTQVLKKNAYTQYLAVEHSTKIQSFSASPEVNSLSDQTAPIFIQNKSTVAIVFPEANYLIIPFSPSASQDPQLCYVYSWAANLKSPINAAILFLYFLFSDAFSDVLTQNVW